MSQVRLGNAALPLAVAGAFSLASSAYTLSAQASGFALIEQNASGLGNAYSGAAAVAEDASTIYFNPAGMSLLPRGRQVSVGLSLIQPSAKFSDSGSRPSGTGIAPAALRPLGGTGGDAGSLAAVPNLYFATDLAANWKFGIGLSGPFGLKTEYDPDWMGRFQAIKSEVKTINLNPSLSFRLNDSTSLGFGLNYQQFDAELSNAVNYSAAAFGAVFQATGNAATAAGAAGTVAAAGAEGVATVKGKDSAWGYNLGAMFQLSPSTRLGLAYRSSVKYHVTGTVSFSGAPTATLNAISPLLAARLSGGNVNLDIELPDSFSIAMLHQLDPKWTLVGDVSWTGWSKIKELNIVRDNGATLSNTPENFRDTWRAGLGAIYRYNEAWSLKGGIAYDQTPVNDTDRTPRLPDNNRTWLSFGGQYRLSKASVLDFSYAHLFVKEASIDQNAGSTPASGRLVGTYKNSVDILGVQFQHSF